MKKLLVLMLVLGMASLANAGLALSVNGEPAPDQITLAPSDWIELDVHLEQGTTLLGMTIAIELSNNQGHIETADISYPDLGAWLFAPYVLSESPQHVEVTGGTFGAPTAGPAVVIAGVMFHCDEPIYATIDLVTTAVTTIDGVDVQAGVLLDRLIVLVPEPMTMVLLGLGAVLLRRKH